MAKQLSPIPEHLFGSEQIKTGVDQEDFWPVDVSEAHITNTALQAMIYTIRQARRTAEHAQSWRGFKVGAVALAWDPARSKLGYFGGFNIKPQAGESALNIHAEQMAIDKARYSGFTWIEALAVWGPRQRNESDRTQPDTLHPCELCCEFMAGSPVISPTTAILSGNQDLSVCELYTLNELGRYHDTGDIQLQRIDFSDAAMNTSGYNDQYIGQILDARLRINPDLRSR